MGRSHAWLPRGTELIEPRPMNWGDEPHDGRGDARGPLADLGDGVAGHECGGLRGLGAAPLGALPAPRRHRRARQLGRAQDRAVRAAIEDAGATVRFLPPYSYDFNPIESGWALIKKRIRAVAPRTSRALRVAAQRARRVVRPDHCRQWFAHAGYQLK